MSFSWIRDNPPRWDAYKKRLIAEAPVGIFDTRYTSLVPGDPVAGEWWRVLDGDQVVGFGWLDVVWGDAEILLATAPDARGRGVGAFILERLDAEARERGLNYLYNIVRTTHPEGAKVTAWLQKHGFHTDVDGRLVRAVKR